jgi:hypothetical protein
VITVAFNHAAMDFLTGLFILAKAGYILNLAIFLPCRTMSQFLTCLSSPVFPSVLLYRPLSAVLYLLFFLSIYSYMFRPQLPCLVCLVFSCLNCPSRCCLSCPLSFLSHPVLATLSWVSFPNCPRLSFLTLCSSYRT